MWQTIIPLSKADKSLKINDKVFCTGSCFADSIGKRLGNLRLPVMNNPFGVLYNPYSLSRQFAHICKTSGWNADVCFQHQGLWRHFDFHSRVSLPDKPAFIHRISRLLNDSRAFLQETRMVVLTLGTSFVWETQEGSIVGNCHKLPGHQFDRRLLTTEEITDALNNIVQNLTTLQPQIQILITVSPIRHLRDGLVQSQRSKARLIDASHEAVEKFDRVSYFPAYEILLDELRDYRYYNSDMVHPSDPAIDYIFDRFFQSYYFDTPIEYIRLITKLNKLEGHLPVIDDNNKSLQQKIEATRIQLADQFGISFE